MLGVRRPPASFLPHRADWAGALVGRDLGAGVVVGLVALPLALGFGISSGMGAGAGLVTAIVAGAVAAVFGGSRVQVSGPTGAMAVVLAPILLVHGPQGVLVVGLMAGLILIGLGWLGAGRTMRYVPLPVVEGFTVGIAVIITLQQVPAALGVDVGSEHVLGLLTRGVRAWLHAPDLVAPVMTAVVAAVVLVGSRTAPRLPIALTAVAVATLANLALHLGARSIGHITGSLPAPHLPTVSLGALDQLVLPAVAVAALAALESLLSATVADAMSGGPAHDPDRELVGQGLANLVTPLFGGIPATAAIARTAVNVRSGATSRLAALTHALVLLAVVLLAAPLVGRIPLAALAGVLIATAVQMVRVSSLAALLSATRGDAVVLVVTAVATVTFDLVTAVVVGLVLAGFFGLRQTARSARLVPEHVSDQHLAFHLDGPLFFAAAHDVLQTLGEVGDVRVVELRMARVSAVDATGAHVLAGARRELERRGVEVRLHDVSPAHERVLRRLNVLDDPGGD
ncbi:SulP family inorganic anion transporter [Nocardioides mangrovicus]|uniref:SulP family inorganic anion transporter n=1 Tax=Nocardioides mangrovicus TaxID=2478913 RepID=A0A3L8NXW3_9ACTN|nr:SulP family inorganic anion transporter [Nocardioides mangrovicus]RLV48056.1 SulP family inorganic anion transporter [Nocardioides mangrovicus]